MWTEPLPNGKFKAVERYTDPITGKQKKISCVIERDTRTARKDAQRTLDSKIEAILGKTDYDNMTFDQLCEKYLETVKKETTRTSQSFVLKRLKKELGENARINALTANYVMDCLKSEPDTKYNTSIARLKTVILFAYRHDYIKDASWLDKITPRKDNRKERIEDKYLEPEELTTLLQSMENVKHWQLLTKFLALSGLRIGEALALTMDDIDTHIHVTKTIDIKTGVVMDTTKTADSNRDVYIQPELAEVIAGIRKWRLAYMMKNKIRENLLFPDLTYITYYDCIVSKSKKVIGRKITPHALRHTHTSLLAAAGVSLDSIARRLGHADSDITKKVYLHVTEKLREKEEAEMAKIKLL